MEDRRSAERLHIGKQAAIISPRLFARAIIRNISVSGACIELFSPVSLPESFRLRIPNYDTFPATLVWQNGLVAGLRFGDPIRDSAVATLAKTRRQPARALASE
ncbi:PilZ domain-containing protein [Afifella pfennigii]|uniref:PilZ domain-containing protein n=1 Tax=Afifella pfennigii TaxID=209897 RepID=UPI00047C49E9|nr:PilZ domain-containing protein [Afifella pfennigii]